LLLRPALVLAATGAAAESESVAPANSAAENEEVDEDVDAGDTMSMLLSSSLEEGNE